MTPRNLLATLFSLLLITGAVLFTHTHTTSAAAANQNPACNNTNFPLDLTFTADQTTVPVGGSTTLHWSALNEDNQSCDATGGTGGWAGTKDCTDSVANSQTITFASAGTYTFTLTGTDFSGGTLQKTVVISTGAPAAPTVTFSANPTTISVGGSSTLAWTSANATSCTGTGFATAGATSGTASVSPGTTSDYQVACTGPGGTTTKLATVTVLNPAVSISTNPDRGTAGDTVTVSWSATDVSACTVTGTNGFTGTCTVSSGSCSGSKTVTLSVVPATYTISCDSGTVSKTARVSAQAGFGEF